MRLRRTTRPKEPTPSAAPPPAERAAVDAAALDAEIDQREAAGDLAGALDLLAARQRVEPDGAREIRLRDLRLRAGAAAAEVAVAGPWPPSYPDPFPTRSGEIPEVDATALTTELLGGAVAHHGALIVRGALADEQVQRLADAIETTHQRKQASPDAADAPELDPAWYQPLTDIDDPIRRWVANTGGTWLGDSPRSTEIVLAELAAAGVVDAIAGHLGERPVISLQKSTLRRTLPDYLLIAWHQDGSFLGEEVRTMNVWVALSPCGGDEPSPGLEIVPRRQDEILGVDGILSPISVPQETVDEQAETTPTVIPRFAPGDALIFDERLLHRTHLTEGMTDIRYALECWFFAPSQVTEAYTPLLA